MAATSAIPKSKVSGGSFLLEERKPSEIFTPEDFSEQHQLIAQTAEDFAVNEIIPNAEKIEHKDFSITRDLLKKAGELGLSSVDIPEAYGGMEMDKVSSAIIADHVGKYAGFATTWGGHTASARCLSFISERKNRKRSTCPGWQRARSSGPMRFLRRLPDPTRLTAGHAPSCRKTASITS